MPKQRTTTIDVYTFDELSEESKQRAIETYRNDEANSAHDLFFLSDNMNEYLHELLEENHITPLKNGYNEDRKVFYSLSYSQGDGAMFVGRFVWDKYPDLVFKVKHDNGHYYHSNSKDIEIYYGNDHELAGEEPNDPLYSDAKIAFDKVYHVICKELERRGYGEIEYTNSDEYITETLTANECEFDINGRII